MHKKLFFILLCLSFSFAAKAVETVSNPKGLVFLLHGCDQSDSEFNNSTKLEERLKAEGFQVAYINTQYLNYHYRCWQWFSEPFLNPKSLQMKSYLSEIQAAQKKYHITPEKTYLIGFSSGAGMALNISICHENLIGGIAIHAGPAFGRATGYEALKFMSSPRAPQFNDIISSCDPKKYHGHALVVHGELDDMVHPDHSNLIFEDFGASMVNVDDCEASLTEVRTTWWQKGAQKLQQIFVPHLGHAWGGGDPKYSKYVKKDAPSTTEAMIQFLKSL